MESRGAIAGIGSGWEGKMKWAHQSRGSLAKLARFSVGTLSCSLIGGLIASACTSGPRRLETDDSHIEIGGPEHLLYGGAAYWRVPSTENGHLLYQFEMTDSSRTRGLILRSVHPFEGETTLVGIGGAGRVDSLPWAEYEPLEGGTRFWSDSGELRITSYKGWRNTRLKLFLSPRGLATVPTAIEMHGQISTF